MKEEQKVLEVIAETEILGIGIKMFRSFENPLFLAKDVANWIDYAKNPNGSRQVNKMLKTVDKDEKLVVKVLLPDDTQIREHSFLTEDGLYECCMRSTKPIAKELAIGEYKLFAFLRRKKIFFYNKDMVNIPYERFRKEEKFVVKETPCHDGNIRAVTYSTKKGLDYIRKLLRKDGFYNIALTGK